MMQDIKDIFNFNAEPIYLIEKKDAKPLNYLINLSTLPDIHSYVLREDYLDQLIYILNKKQKNNPLLIGQAGVGKTALVTALAKMIDQDIYELDLGELIAGTKYRGEMEEKLTQAIDYIYEHNAILFIDEVHNIVGAGSNDGSLDAANILKPYLSRGKVKVIAATTLDEYYKYIEKDKALVRRFRTVFINEPTKEETLTILKGIKQDYIKYYNYNIQDDLLEYIVNLTDNRILEFDQINSGNGGGEYACLKRIGEFEVRGFVQYINKNGEIVRGNTKESWSAYARFRDISQGMGVKIETMVDVIDHYDEIIDFFKMIAIEQYNTNKYVFRVDSEDRKAFIWVHQINGYYWYHWHGVKEDEFVGENFYGSENWREKVNNDLPKIRKSLGLEN